MSSVWRRCRKGLLITEYCWFLALSLLKIFHNTLSLSKIEVFLKFSLCVHHCIYLSVFVQTQSTRLVLNFDKIIWNVGVNWKSSMLFLKLLHLPSRNNYIEENPGPKTTSSLCADISIVCYCSKWLAKPPTTPLLYNAKLWAREGAEQLITPLYPRYR